MFASAVLDPEMEIDGSTLTKAETAIFVIAVEAEIARALKAMRKHRCRPHAVQC